MTGFLSMNSLSFFIYVSIYSCLSHNPSPLQAFSVSFPLDRIFRMFFLSMPSLKSPSLLIALLSFFYENSSDWFSRKLTSYAIRRRRMNFIVVFSFPFSLWFLFIAGTIVVKSLFFRRDPSSSVCCE